MVGHHSSRTNRACWPRMALARRTVLPLGLIQPSGVAGPGFEDLVAAIAGFVAHAALVAVFLAGLNVQRFSEQLAVLDIVAIDPVQQSAIVGPRILRREVPCPSLGRLE